MRSATSETTLCAQSGHTRSNGHAQLGGAPNLSPATMYATPAA